jgi:hypothetical protein
MLIAVHPNNKELHSKEYPQCFTQGQLIYALEQEPCQEILIDKDIPGHLKLEDLLNYIERRFPDAQVSVIEAEVNLPAIIQKPTLNNLALPVITGGVSILVYLLLTIGGEQQIVPVCLSLLVGIVVTTLAHYLSKEGGYNK